MFFPLNIETLKRVGKTIVKINIEITPGHNLHIICSAKIIPVFWVISYKLCFFSNSYLQLRIKCYGVLNCINKGNLLTHAIGLLYRFC